MEPLFLLAAAPLILGEFPSGLGLIGVFLIMSGAYLLNLKENQKGIFSPIKAILQEKGPRLMIIVAMLWSISSSIDKVGLTNSSAAFWVICLNGFLSLSLFPLMALKSKSLDELPKNLKLTAPAGFFNGIANLFQMIAFSMTLVIYVASIKKLSSVLTVIYGGIMLKEKGLKRRLAATLLMVLGSIVILLGA
jgi:drug/metabolite transporter (DMT)-like permease